MMERCSEGQLGWEKYNQPYDTSKGGTTIEQLLDFPYESSC
jgi:hypothetical protein